MRYILSVYRCVAVFVSEAARQILAFEVLLFYYTATDCIAST